MSVKPTGARGGVSLLELVAAIMIAATIATMSIFYLRKPGTTAHQRSCDLTRKVLQEDAHRYRDMTGNLPGAQLLELGTPEYTGTVLPTCPVTGESYRLGGGGIVECPTHEATRVK